MSGEGGDSSTDATRNRFADLGPRLSSAAVLLAAAILAVWLGGPYYSLVISISFAGVYREWEIMIGLQAISRSGMIITGIVALFPFAAMLAGPWSAALLAGAALVVALAFRQDLFGWRITGLVLMCVVMVALVAVRGTELRGVAAGVFLGVAVWMTDTGALFAGRQFGGAKLNPGISPAKTWSGAIGGLVVGSACALIVWLVVVPHSPWWIGLLIAIGTSISGQLGDLCESAIKRLFKVKDSGDIIPGHGGLMDRLDSLTFGALFMFLVGLLHGGFDAVPDGILIW